MDIDFKEILSKVSVFKNNPSLLVSIIIALVAALLLIPDRLLGSKLGARVQTESIPKWRAIENIKRSPVESFTEDSIEARKQAHATDANEIIALAEQTTLRELLSYDIFPKPDPNKGVSGLTFVEFGQRYRAGIEGLIKAVKGGSCHTDVEIQNGLEDSAARMNRRPGMGMGVLGGGSPYDMGALARRPLGMVEGMSGGPRSEIDRIIVDKMCEERARSLSVYVNPIDIAGYDHWADYKFDPNTIPAVKDAWYHQLAYWVIEDIFSTIDTMNSERDILSAPVKRLVRLSFTMGLKRPGSRGSGKGVIRAIGGRKARSQDEAESDRPAYVIEDKHGLTESLTARYADSKSAIDVIHFNVAAVVATRDILPFMQQLCSSKEHKFSGYPDGAQPEQTFRHNQITILEFKTGAVNEYDPVHRYHSYGDDGVVVLDLICEYIFNRKAHEPIMPPAVIEELDSIEAGA
ncbi:MAG: hypothetical protein ACYSWQ_14565 [Planctomycetota bacterium]|jgi:hypothetical protein